MSPTRTILRFNLALDRILSAIVQLRASVVTPLCRPPSLRLRVVPPLHRKLRQRRHPRRLRNNHRQVTKAFAFATALISAPQLAVRNAFDHASVDIEMRPISTAPSPTHSAESVEFVMDIPPISLAAPTPHAPSIPLAPPPFNPRQSRRPTLLAFPPSPPPVPPTKSTQLALARFPNSWPSLPLRSGSPIRAADQTFVPNPYSPPTFVSSRGRRRKRPPPQSLLRPVLG